MTKKRGIQAAVIATFLLAGVIGFGASNGKFVAKADNKPVVEATEMIEPEVAMETPEETQEITSETTEGNEELSDTTREVLKTAAKAVAVPVKEPVSTGIVDRQAQKPITSKEVSEVVGQIEQTDDKNQDAQVPEKDPVQTPDDSNINPDNRQDNIQQPEEHQHSWLVLEDVSPICGKDGYIRYSCMCGEEKTEVVPHTKEEHTLVVTTVQPTCTEAGYIISKCADCGYVSDYKELPKTDHYYSAVKAVAPSCSSEGRITYRCQKCGDEYTESIAPDHSSHTHVELKEEVRRDGTVVRSAVCTECGTTLRTETISPKNDESTISDTTVPDTAESNVDSPSTLEME